VVGDKLQDEEGTNQQEDDYIVKELLEWRTNAAGEKEVLVLWGGEWDGCRSWQPETDVSHLEDDLKELYKLLPAQWSFNVKKKGKKQKSH
jgi:hypothetical protein